MDLKTSVTPAKKFKFMPRCKIFYKNWQTCIFEWNVSGQQDENERHEKVVKSEIEFEKFAVWSTLVPVKIDIIFHVEGWDENSVQ